jgi:hypothetical protein
MPWLAWTNFFAILALIKPTYSLVLPDIVSYPYPLMRYKETDDSHGIPWKIRKIFYQAFFASLKGHLMLAVP